ncbi:cupin domain-containing protein [Dyadobacter sp. 3J3]|uniref:cupin domain-containing protein n=1 Tax=Dyadobacter sp. 3J3 TaxID=2606600 RepID=UPI00135B87FA|nr:cupin domain-containing protein [Dyadobacter sp. 3J3]
MKKKFWLFGTNLTIVVDEIETDGKYDLIDGIVPACVETPLHLHTKYSEAIYVLEGELTVYLENRTLVLKPGDSVFIPRGAQHVVAASGATNARALTVASPSGFAELIRQVGTLNEPDIDDPKINDMLLFLKVSEKIGDVIIGSPGSRPMVL